ncbi:inositol-3-phosphate synthase [Patescibacteria group bacterium]|nr:inositol-3-phosphate synthase [Patescibacteria group bacterium]MBU3999656.1 inositol-3-phosphate synthase [Patescibacteria group bacterium]MBU4057171.1 inositol-3-phosphate synthase [Patescibacteria group bacterium]MBU4369001.1 inositol-3-phosphate synthase [Patescibacteria group bacterium]
MAKTKRQKEIRIAIAGVGNCASSLVQGIEYYKKNNSALGLMHPELGGYKVSDIKVVAAFDVNKDKVGKDVSKAIFDPNTINTVKIADVPYLGVKVMKAPVMDGVGEYLGTKVKVSDKNDVDVVKELKKSGVEILINYLPVGSYTASRFYADVAIKAMCAFINFIPEFIASDAGWIKKFEQAGLPIIGDDNKGQLGASILSRVLVNLFKDRGGKIERMYQLNFGGNTDFLNLLEHSRLKSKRISKTETVQSQMSERLRDDSIHIGPSDYVPWLKSRKIANIRIEGKTFGDIPIYIDLKLDVEDKSVATGVAVDAIRCAKLALNRGISGVLESPSAYFMKFPAKQYPDWQARQMLEEFIAGKRER